MDYSFLAARQSFTFIYTCVFFSTLLLLMLLLLLEKKSNRRETSEMIEMSKH